MKSVVYIGDVPVEASYHGSALLYRLLLKHADRLTVVETATPSDPRRRLPDSSYVSHPIAKQRWLNTRFHAHAVAWFSRAAPRSAPKIAHSLNGSNFGSVLTVAHGFGWLAAADVAAKRNLPLHLMVHDDWPRVANVTPAFRKWLDGEFARVYRQAQSRFCVSPSMRSAYQENYGRDAEVLYPIRAANSPDFDCPPARLGQNNAPFTIAFAGSINSDGYVQALIALQDALQTVGGRLLIFGPLTKDASERIGLNEQNTKVCGLLSASDLLARVREEVDALFVPMSFASADRANMALAFPSKLADSTAAGVPLLIYGPPYCSAVKWASEHPGVAEVIDVQGRELAEAVQRLARDPAHRVELGKRALGVGRRYFSPETVQQVFDRGLAISS